MKVAWIGLGRIGTPMALQVLRAGHELTGHARSPEKARDVAVAGGRITPSLTAAMAGADLVCVNVYAEAQLRDAMLAGGALTAMTAGATLVIHSTVGPSVIRELAASRPDIHVLDAAFSGTAENAAEGTITLMVGGSAAALDTHVLSRAEAKFAVPEVIGMAP